MENCKRAIATDCEMLLLESRFRTEEIDPDEIRPYSRIDDGSHEARTCSVQQKDNCGIEGEKNIFNKNGQDCIMKIRSYSTLE